MTVKLLIIYPMDPLGPKVGGAETFLKAFIKNAPGDNENFFFCSTFRNHRGPDFPKYYLRAEIQVSLDKKGLQKRQNY